MTWLTVAMALLVGPLADGLHERQVCVDGERRAYLVYVPPGLDPACRWPVVLAFHGAGANARQMLRMSGLNDKADAARFVVVYPEGTGVGPLKSFNGGGRGGAFAQQDVDDVAFTRVLLDDLASVLPVDDCRVFATGISNGGMMCHRLAIELPERIAAIAPVAGTLAIPPARPARGVSVMHFHGRADGIVPWNGPNLLTPRFLKFLPVDETLETWRQLNECPGEWRLSEYENVARDGTLVRRRDSLPGRDGAEVVLIEIEGGGHTWPGRPNLLVILGKTTRDISANDVMWEFFERHPLPGAGPPPP
ncbi:MAG: alpha/beta hydrolase family esterase [Planctomycetaceae bacterium]